MSDTISKSLRQFTGARVALNRTGSSISLNELLDFQLAHARARDAVHESLDLVLLPRLIGELKTVQARRLSTLVLESAAPDRATYLRRPDLGRRLSDDSEARLPAIEADIVFVLADGLSARAVLDNAPQVLEATLDLLDTEQWKIAPICIVKEGRVAVGDSVGARLKAKLAVVMIGERPGLTTPTSMGLYVTWDPAPGRNDAERNCISNIHAQGLSPQEAARRMAFYLQEGRRRQLTGVDLKYSHSLPDRT